MNRKIHDVVAKSYSDIKNTRTTSQIPQASVKRLCKSKIKMEHQKKVRYYLKKRQHIVD